MNILRRSLLSVLLATSFAFAQGAGKDIQSVEDMWLAAVKGGDSDALGNLLADDLVYTHSTGTVDTKTDYMTKLKSGEQKYASMEYSDMKVRKYGNTAVVNAQIHMTGATKGVPFDNRMYVVHVWVKQGAGWKLVTHQTTKKAM